MAPPLMPRFLNAPMQPRPDVPSFDLTRNLGPSRSLVTGDRSLTRNPGGMAGLPLAPMSEQIGSRGMTDQRRSEMAGRLLAKASRQGDMNATIQLYRGPTGYGRGLGRPQGPPPGFGMPMQRPAATAPGQALAPAAPPNLTPLPPPMSTEQALGLPGAAPSPTNDSAPPPMPMAPNLPWQNQPLPGFDSSMSLPPSTLMGGAGLPPPPRFSESAVGGMNLIVDNTTNKQVASYKPEPNLPPPTFEMRQDATGAYRQFYDGKPLPGEPTYSGQVQPGSYVRQATQGQPAPMQYTPNLPQPVERVTIGPDGQETRTLTRPQGSAPAGEAKGGNYFDSLLPAAPTASTQTGQMPNEAYAAPLSPEQMLEEARNEYARTGNDAALKQYFAQYPSEAVRLNQQEQQIWGQVAGQVDRLGRAASNRVDAQDARNAYINRYSGSPFTQGAISAEFEQNFPGAMRAINSPLPMPDVNLIGNANDLSRRAAAAAGRTMPAIAPRAAPQPLPPPLPMMQAERNPEGFVARLNQLPTLPAFMRPTIRR